jgi:hypothetical protein
MEVLAMNSPFSVKVWQLQYEQFFDPKLKLFFFNNFEAFIKKNPSALWQASLLQRKFMQFNLGADYWDNKIEQYRVTREKLGIQLV